MRDAPTKKNAPGTVAAVDVATNDAPRAVRLLRGGVAGGVVSLRDEQPLVIGRGHSADIVFIDDDVSRLHGHLKKSGGAWRYTDARSQNGSFLARGEAAASTKEAFASAVAIVDEVVVAPGDVVFVGGSGSALVFVDDAVAPITVAAHSAVGRALDDALARAARASGPVLLLGPSGAGKTWAARRIHDESGRRGAFVVLNAAALPTDPTALRSVLLGHKKGAFTGADRDVVGAFVAADHGTLFLDEVDSLSPAGQGFLLTLLEQSGDLLPLGAPPLRAGETLAKRDVRVVAASKTALAQAGLRSDLAYRLVDGSLVELPALSARRADIPGLVAGFLDELAREDGRAAAIDDDALAACVDAPWPGQVRQLRGVVRLLAREAADRRIRRVDVEGRLAALARALGEAPASPTSAPTTVTATATAPSPKKARQLTAEDVRAALDASGGNLQHTADRLGVARNTLVAKMAAFGIARPRKDG